MKCYIRTIISGKVVEVEMYHSIRAPGVHTRRCAHYRESSAKQRLMNEIHAKQRLTRLLNCNFAQGDSYITLTYRGKEPTLSHAKKQLERYLRRLRDLRKKTGLPALKYICVTEAEGCRVNHHIITQRMDERVLIDLWQYDSKGNPILGHGRAPCDRLDWSLDYTFLARYIGKEKKAGKRWNQSRNLTKPKVSPAREINTITIRRAYRAPKGYRIAEERFSSSDITGDYRYIRMVPEAVEFGSG